MIFDTTNVMFDLNITRRTVMNISKKLLTITQRHPPPPWDDAARRIREFKDAAPKRRLEIIKWCVENSTPINVDWGQNWTYSRARAYEKLDNRPKNVSDLIWPPDQYASSGRVNHKGKPLMYVGDREGTALSEIIMKDGYAVVSEYQITHKKGVRIIPIGEFTAIHRTGRGPFLQNHSDVITGMINACDYQEAQSMLLIDSFLADTMANTDANYNETTYLAETMFRKIPKATAIAYPSVKRRGGMNIAAKTIGFWDNWSFVGAYFASYDAPGAGSYKALSRTCVNGVYANGRLRWAEEDANIRVKIRIDPFKPHPDYPIRVASNGVGAK